MGIRGPHGRSSFVPSPKGDGPWLRGLPPEGLDTPFVESLSGYLQRLGNAYLIPPGDLLRELHSSAVLADWFLTSPRAMDGARSPAESSLAWLASVTGRSDLRGSTLLALSDRGGLSADGCNERLAAERAHKREALLQATEALLAPIVAATQREKRTLKGQEKIALRVGKVIAKYKMAKHFELDITETTFAWRRNTEAIAGEAALDGLYIVRTSVAATELDAEHTVRAYKGLSVVERAFRSLKTVDLKVRPIYHYAGERVRAHVFLCMLAYYVEWHMRQRLKPLLFDDEEPEVAEAARPSVVAPAQVSPSAQDKARRKRTASGESVHSLRTLLDDLATIAKNRMVAPLADAEPFDLITRPTALQRKAFKLLGVRLERTQ